MESTKEKFISPPTETNPDISPDKRKEEEQNKAAPGEKNFPKEFPFGIPENEMNWTGELGEKLRTRALRNREKSKAEKDELSPEVQKSGS